MKMFTELYDTFLMAGRIKMPPLTRKWQYVFMLAVITFNPGKSHMRISAVKKLIDIIVYHIAEEKNRKGKETILP
jgi:hypothetical protein